MAAKRLLKWAKKYKVNPRDLQPVMRWATLIVYSVFTKHNKQTTITCTGGGDHSSTSLHPWGFAFDVRTRHLSEPLKLKILEELNREFRGTGYQIVWYSSHFHVEYDPPDWKMIFHV